MDMRPLPDIAKPAAPEKQDADGACSKFLKETSAGRELLLAGQTLGSIPGAFADAITKHPGETIAKVAGAAVISGALGFFSRRTGLLAFAARATVPAMGIAFATDIVSKFGDIKTAMGNAWQSDANWQDN